MFDTHCHLYLEQFSDDLDYVFNKSISAGVEKFLIPGIDFLTSNLSVQLSSQYPDAFYAAVGIHPNYSEQVNEHDISSLLKAFSKQIIAIGEIGLDYYRTYSPKDKQVLVLEKMFVLAEQYQLPICLHNRDADSDLIDCLTKYYSTDENKKGVFHAYDGSPIIAEWGIAHEFMFGIGGLITYKNNDKLRDRVKIIGLDRIILETDSPYLSPTPFRGKRNDPSNLVLIVDKLAEIFNVNHKIVENTTDSNALTLFGFK